MYSSTFIPMNDEAEQPSTKWANYFDSLYADSEGLEVEEKDGASDNSQSPRDEMGQPGRGDSGAHPSIYVPTPPSLQWLLHLPEPRTAPAASVRQCANPNCGKSTSSNWYLSTLLPEHLRVCAACYGYEARHSQHRPRALAHRPSECGNCRKNIRGDRHRSRSRLALRQSICGTCGSYEQKYGKARPLSSPCFITTKRNAPKAPQIAQRRRSTRSTKKSPTTSTL
ncbi:hypothetical protein B0H16DRAFT_1593467, partial [Mycena metata]